MVPITALPLSNRIDHRTVANFPWNSDDMVSFEVAVRDGHFAVISDDVERLTGGLSDILCARPVIVIR